MKKIYAHHLTILRLAQVLGVSTVSVFIIVAVVSAGSLTPPTGTVSSTAMRGNLYTTPGSYTWVPPTGVGLVYVSASAGGGGGGGGGNRAGNGGNSCANIGGGGGTGAPGGGAGDAGEAIWRFPLAVSGNLSIVVGSGGAGTPGGTDPGTEAGNGGNSSFGNYTLRGGNGGWSAIKIDGAPCTSADANTTVAMSGGSVGCPLTFGNSPAHVSKLAGPVGGGSGGSSFGAGQMANAAYDNARGGNACDDWNLSPGDSGVGNGGGGLRGANYSGSKGGGGGGWPSGGGGGGSNWFGRGGAGGTPPTLVAGNGGPAKTTGCLSNIIGNAGAGGTGGDGGPGSGYGSGGGGGAGCCSGGGGSGSSGTTNCTSKSIGGSGVGGSGGNGASGFVYIEW